MIKLEVVDNAEQHFTVRADEPVRIEVRVIGGRVMMHAYEGVVDDEDQDTLGAYDGTLGDENRDWASRPEDREELQRTQR